MNRSFWVMLFLVLSFTCLKGDITGIRKELKDTVYLQVYISPEMLDVVPRDILYFEGLKDRINKLGSWDNNQEYQPYASPEALWSQIVDQSETQANNHKPVIDKIIINEPVHILLAKYDFLKTRKDNGVEHFIEKYDTSRTKNDDPEVEYYFLKLPAGYLKLSGDVMDIIHFDWELNQEKVAKVLDDNIETILEKQNNGFNFINKFDPLGLYIIPCENYAGIYKEITALHPEINAAESTNFSINPVFDETIKGWRSSYIYYFNNTIYHSEIIIGNGFLVTKLEILIEGPAYNTYPYMSFSGDMPSFGFGNGDSLLQERKDFYAEKRIMLDKYHHENKFEDEILTILAKNNIKKEKRRIDLCESGSGSSWLSGTVVNSKNEPLADAEIFVLSDNRSLNYDNKDAYDEYRWDGGRGVTNTAGEYKIDNIMPGIYNLYMEVPGYEWRYVHNVEIKDNAGLTINFNDLKEEGVLDGNVDEDSSGYLRTDIADAYIYIKQPGVAGYRLASCAKTDEDGYYKLKNMPSGEFDIECIKAGYSVGKLNKVKIKSGERITLPNFTLKKKDYVIYGQLFDYDGQTIGGVEIWLLDKNETVLDSTTSGQDGIFSFSGIYIGDFALKLPRYPWVFQPVSVETAFTKITLCNIKITGGAIIGKVTSADGEELDDERLACFSEISNDTARTDCDGNYTMVRLAEGIYKVQLQHQSGSGYSDVIIDNVKVVNGRDTIVNITMNPAREGGKITGKVTDIEGTPIETAKVVISMPGQLPSSVDYTNEKGEYVLDSLTSGKYTIDIFTDIYAIDTINDVLLTSKTDILIDKDSTVQIIDFVTDEDKMARKYLAEYEDQP